MPLIASPASICNPSGGGDIPTYQSGLTAREINAIVAAALAADAGRPEQAAAARGAGGYADLTDPRPQVVAYTTTLDSGETTR